MFADAFGWKKQTRFSHKHFGAAMFGMLRERNIPITDEVKNRINLLTWKRGRWSGDMAFEVLALIEDILDTKHER